jgi:phenylpropionate dioxygenase-like ring-hydroxylating dioxygenase large terminal subunit
MQQPGAAAEVAFARALEPFWHAVARGVDVPAERPVLVELLGRPLVLARLDGALACLDDTCRHLGASLSIGEIVDGCLRCAYHGWTYDAAGRCVDIPARRGLPIPKGARVRAYALAERYGLIWVCLADPPSAAIPAFPEFDDPRFRVTPPRAYPAWSASAPRLVMGALDDTHFAWVHPGLLGDPAHPEPPDHRAWREGTAVVSTYRHLQPANESIGGAAGAMEEVDYTNRATATSIHLLKAGPAGSYAILMAFCPVSAMRTIPFLITARDFDTDPDRDESYLEFEDRVQAQDRRVVESQRPWLLPPLSARLQLYVRPADLPLVEFQRYLEELGVPQV